MTTPDELIDIPETAELSESLTIDHVQELEEPVPPEIVGVELLLVP